MREIALAIDRRMWNLKRRKFYVKIIALTQDLISIKRLYFSTLAFGMDQEIPDYDMDSEDETWLTKQAKKMEVTPLQFENMMDRLEKGSGQVVSF